MQVTEGTWHMRKQCVPGSLSSSTAQEPGNEARSAPPSLRTMAVSQSGKTAFGQAMSYALSKVGKPEMVLKNEL